MKLTILGSGTSTGVPLIGCSCSVCLSTDAKDNRLRSSILIEHNFKSILVDTGPDLRAQILRHHVTHLDAVLITHGHYDHLGGLNDLRGLTAHDESYLDCFVNEETYNIIQTNYPYMFQKNIPGQTKLTLKKYTAASNTAYENFHIHKIDIQPIKMIHIPNEEIESVGFVFNKKVGYLTDFKWILKENYDFLYNLDILILGSPIFKTHPTHISIPEALELFNIFKPKLGILTHLGHNMNHEELTKILPPNIIPAYDTAVFHIN